MVRVVPKRAGHHLQDRARGLPWSCTPVGRIDHTTHRAEVRITRAARIDQSLT